MSRRFVKETFQKKILGNAYMNEEVLPPDPKKGTAEEVYNVFRIPVPTWHETRPWATQLIMYNSYGERNELVSFSLKKRIILCIKFCFF